MSDDARPRFGSNLSRTDYLVLIALGLGIMLMVYGVMVGVTGDDRSNVPEWIESLDPVPDAVQIPAQSNVFVDLVEGYTGVLVVDGIELETVAIDDLGSVTVEPGTQIDLPPVTIFEPGNNTLTFTPTDDAEVSSFDTGEHIVEVIYWPIEEGRRRARTYTWTFNVV